MAADADLDLAPRAASPLARIAAGQGLMRDGRHAQALAEADAALAVLPAQVDALLLRATALAAMGRFAPAAAAFHAVLAQEPDRAAVHVSLANAEAELGDLAGAEGLLRRALSLAPRLRGAHASLISVCAAMGRDDLTEAACRDALAIDPHASNAHQHLAALHAARGELVMAQTHRDAAYRRQNLFVEPALGPAPVALVLMTAEDGNIPLKYLMSRDRYTKVTWFIDYATPDQPMRLPHHDVVFNAIGEPELPAATHTAVERFRAQCQVPFLNRPDRVALTSRTALPDLLDGLDVVVPPAVRWRRGEAMPGIGPKLLVRPVGSHGGAGLVLATTAAGFSAATQAHAACDVTAFQPFASADGLFRKYRAIFVDRRPLPYHLAVADHWLVHYVTADMPGHAARRDEERRFLDDPQSAIGARAMQGLAAIGARLDLDYAGVDFSVLPDGRVVVFEANATMVVHPETDGGMLAYKNPAVRAILAAFDRMAAPGR